MNSIKLNEFVIKEIKKVSTISEYLWEKGWAERNAGNISIDFTDQNLPINDDLNIYTYVALDSFPNDAAGAVLFITGTGMFLRDLIIPEKAGCIIRIDDEAKGYHIVWGGNSDPEFKATSEINSHVKIHLAKKKSNSPHRAVVHTHPIELIAVSHHPHLGKNESKLNRVLWSMLPEVRAFVPRGISLLPYMLPGFEELGDLTYKALLEKDVAIWRKHGVIASGKDAEEAFDYIDVANKGAAIYLKCLSSGFEPEGMSDEELDELAEAFDL